MVKVFDPTRDSYNKSHTKETDCYFCNEEVIQNQECTQFVFEYWMVLVNKHPYMTGNVMLIPKSHVVSNSDLTEAEWSEFPKVLKEVETVLTKMFETESFNIGLNVGEESGRSVEHLHWQIIPRKRSNHTVVGVLADIQVITLSPDELKKRLSTK